MKDNRKRIIAVILLLSFVFFMILSPSIIDIIQDGIRTFVLSQTLFFLCLGVFICQFVEIILFTHKLE